NVVPAPSTLRTRRSPPIPRANPRLMARPSPVPSLLLVRLRWICTNGSKIDISRLVGIPAPVSLTRRNTTPVGPLPSPRLPVSTVMQPSHSVNLTALDNRLSRICHNFSVGADDDAGIDPHVVREPFRRQLRLDHRTHL